MRKRITAIGNSAGIILDKPILSMVGLGLGMEVQIELSGDGAIVLRPVQGERRPVAEHARHVMKRQDKTFRRLAE